MLNFWLLRFKRNLSPVFISDSSKQLSTLLANFKAKHSLSIAAYKSSLRGKHVFGSTSQKYSEQGEQVYEVLLNAGLKRKLAIRMVENGPSKDKGDNEDGRSLQQLGALSQRTLNLQKIFGSGTMHTKFILADNKDFYLGSANLDWRSLNQKMEQGVLVTDCPCLAQDLSSVFEVYWKAAEAENVSQLDVLLKEQSPKSSHQESSVRFSAEKPLNLRFEGMSSDVYLASSPCYMNSQDRAWDLDSIVSSLNSAKTFAYIHVMDYFPMFLYRQQKQFWPLIDNAIRAAVMRGVQVKMICAALHYPEMGLRFLKSMQSITGAAGSVDIKIFKVPSPPGVQSVVKRDRRTHKKFLVTDDTLIIGTSNWSGDYFDDKSTGAAIVIKENSSSSSVIHKIKRIFERDWTSQYAHPVDLYFEKCILHVQDSIIGNTTTDNIILPAFCEPKKDISLLSR